MLEALDVQLAIALVDFAVAILRVRGHVSHALRRALGALGAVEVGGLGLGQVDVAVRAQQLQSLHRRGPQIGAVRDALGVAQVGRAVADDQVVGVDGLADRAVAQRAIVDLFEGRSAEAQHQQHSVGVGIVLGRRVGQVVVQVALKRTGKLVLLEVGVVVVVADLDGAVSRKKLGTCIGLKTQNGLKQQRVPDLAHTLDRRAVGRALKPGDFHLEAQKANAGRPVLDPLLAALDVVVDAAQQRVGDAVQLAAVDVVDDVVKPPTVGLRARPVDGLAVEADGHGAVVVLDAQDVAVGVDVRDVLARLDDYVRQLWLREAGEADVRINEAGCRHVQPFSDNRRSISSTNRRRPSCAAIVSDQACNV